MIVYFSSALCVFSTYRTTAEFYTLSLHDALPISPLRQKRRIRFWKRSAAATATCRYRCHCCLPGPVARRLRSLRPRSEEHTSELQSREKHVCRLLLVKNKLLLCLPLTAMAQSLAQ